MADIPLTHSYPSIEVNPTRAAAAGDTLQNPGDVGLLVKNASAASINVTAVTTAIVAGQAVDDLVQAVAAGVTRLIGPFAPEIFNNAEGRVAINYSALASVTVQPVRLFRG